MYQAIVFLPLLGGSSAAIISPGRRAGALSGRQAATQPTTTITGTQPRITHAPRPRAWSDDATAMTTAHPAAGRRLARRRTRHHAVPVRRRRSRGSRSCRSDQSCTRTRARSCSPGCSPATLKVDWAIRIDTLTAVMLVVVNTVSAFVHLYSIGYMAGGPRTGRASSPTCRCSPSRC